MSKVRRFEVTAAGDFASVLSVLTDHLRLQPSSSASFERTWLETAEGALQALGTSLEHRRPRGDGAPSLLWVGEDRVLALDDCVAAEIPSDAGALPQSPAFARLATAIGSSSLVAGPILRSEVAVVAALDDEEKTTARVVLDASETIDGIAFPMVLEVLPLRGYEDEAKQLIKSLRRHIALVATELSVKERAAAGAPTGSASPLAASMTAASAWRVAFQQLTDAMTKSFPGVMSGADPEDLHAFRVAVRRLRTLLQDGADIIDSDLRDRFRAEYRWLGDVTTPTRDADVRLIEFPELAVFSEMLIRDRNECHAAMATQLRSLRRAEFGTAWLAFLADDELWTACGELADEPVLPVVLRRIERAQRQLIKSGRRIKKNSPPIALHELRKEGKRLRYLLECFGPILNEEALKDVLRPLRRLQEVLGEFQDTEVQAHALVELVQASESSADPSARATLDRVVAQLGVRAGEARSAFTKVFREFDGRSVQRAFSRLGAQPASNTKSTRKKKR